MDLRVCGLVSFKTENLRKTAQAHFPRLQFYLLVATLASGKSLCDNRVFLA